MNSSIKLNVINQVYISRKIILQIPPNLILKNYFYNLSFLNFINLAGEIMIPDFMQYGQNDRIICEISTFKLEYRENVY